jgi:hypothetical protein
MSPHRIRDLEIEEVLGRVESEFARRENIAAQISGRK